MLKLKKEQLDALVAESKMLCRSGHVADYIAELAQVSSDKLGITIQSLDGESLTSGDCNTSFTLQSISKVFSLIIALEDRGEQHVFQKVGMEPTGESYNSMLKLELIPPGIPFNPMINAGAIVISSMISGGDYQERAGKVLNLVRKLCEDESIDYNQAVYKSEYSDSDRNRSLAYFLKNNKVMEGDVEEHLKVYLHHCSIQVTCAQVAKMGAVIANEGKHPMTGEQIISERYVQIIKTFMVTCGMYNASGEFAIKVGIPAKSGVSGGIIAAVPGRSGIGVIGPALDSKGNSVAGVHLLKKISEVCEWSIF